MMGTPTLRQCKMMRGPLPDRRILNGACPLYAPVTPKIAPLHVSGRVSFGAINPHTLLGQWDGKTKDVEVRYGSLAAANTHSQGIGRCACACVCFGGAQAWAWSRTTTVQTARLKVSDGFMSSV